MRSGTLRNKLVIEYPLQVKQTNGSVKTTWTKFADVRGSVETLKGSERASASANWPKADVKIGFRYIEDLLPTMRITCSGKAYSILNIDDVDLRHRDIWVIAETGVKAT